MKWKKTSTETLATAYAIEVQRLTFAVEDRGQITEATRDSVHHNGTVACLLTDHEGRLALELIYRPIFDSQQYEIPAGGIEVGETPESAIVRELREEVGAEVKDLELLTVVQNAPGHTDHLTYIFRASLLSIGIPTAQSIEEEDLQIHWVTKAEIAEYSEKIHDAKTMIGVSLWVS
jgi:ADP-ribose pyrophosphatase